MPTPYIPHHGRVLALDWGTARIGLAITDETQLIARPLTTLTRRAGKRPPRGDFLTIVEREKPVRYVSAGILAHWAEVYGPTGIRTSPNGVVTRHPDLRYGVRHIADPGLDALDVGKRSRAAA